MTNNEAVTILNSIKMFFCREDGTPLSAGYDAIMKAVEVLEHLPEEHGDLIDRDELLKECYPDDEFDAHVIYADDIHKAKAVIAAERKDDERIH